MHHWQNFREILWQWRSDALEFLHRDAPRILLILVVAIILTRLLRILTNRLHDISKNDMVPTGLRAQQLSTLSGVIYGGGVFVITFFALLQILSQVGVNMGPLLASAGIAGLAIGFGAQTLVKDVINGFFILIENHYDIGDVVKIAGVQGGVEKMTLRRTVLRDGDGSVHNVPNSEIKVVTNLTRDWTMLAMRFSVAYGEDSGKVINLLKQVASDLRTDPAFANSLVADPEVPGIDKVSGHEIEYLVLLKCRPGMQDNVARELRRRVKDAFAKNNIQPGDPAQTLVLDAVSAQRFRAPQ